MFLSYGRQRKYHNPSKITRVFRIFKYAQLLVNNKKTKAMDGLAATAIR